MKTSNFLFLSVLISLCTTLSFFISCNDDDTYNETLRVASERKLVDESNAYWVQRIGSDKWELMYSGISDFDHEIGYEYLIVVKIEKVKNPGPDQSSLKYTLIRIISKEKKDSQVPSYTPDFSRVKGQDEIAFPNAVKEVVTLSNGMKITKIDSLYIYQGDIVLNEEQIQNLFYANPNSRSGVSAQPIKYWQNHSVYYTFDSRFTLQQNVLSAIAEWREKTSLEFYEGIGSGDYIEFFHGDGNYTNSIGVKGGKQLISLSKTGSTMGTAIHEIGHAVGLIHEHSRNDRDNYVTIYWNNIESGNKSLFEVYPQGKAEDIGFFDFTSVMLYSSDAFAKEGLYSMTTKGGLYFTGQRSYLSKGDVEGVKSMYDRLP